MAFRAFDERQHMAAAEPPRMAAAAVKAAPAFTPIERSVIALARIENPSSARPRKVLSRLGEILFGISPSKPLANPRLEALRRFAILARASHGNPPEHEIDSFL